MSTITYFIELNKKNLFKKEVIKTGVYPHPHNPDKFFTVTGERLREWVDAFNRSGVKVWVPHHHSGDTRDNAGWVEDIFVEDGVDGEQSLYAVLNITDGETAKKIRDGTIADVSLALEYDFVSANGEVFPELIRHIALTLDPHITNQTPFIQLSKEVNIMKDKEKFAYYDQETGEGYIPHHAEDGTVDLSAVIAGLVKVMKLKVSDDVKSAILSHLTGHIEKALSTKKETGEEGETNLERRTLRNKVERLERELEDYRIREVRMTTISRIQSLLDEGRITPAVARALESFSESVNTTRFGKDDTSLVERIINLFEMLPRTVHYGRMSPAVDNEKTTLSDEERELIKRLDIDEGSYIKHAKEVM